MKLIFSLLMLAPRFKICFWNCNFPINHFVCRSVRKIWTQTHFFSFDVSVVILSTQLTSKSTQLVNKEIDFILYSVMQSDRNSFCGGVVLEELWRKMHIKNRQHFHISRQNCLNIIFFLLHRHHITVFIWLFYALRCKFKVLVCNQRNQIHIETRTNRP